MQAEHPDLAAAFLEQPTVELRRLRLTAHEVGDIGGAAPVGAAGRALAGEVGLARRRRLIWSGQHRVGMRMAGQGSASTS
ncbi:MAG: hypothetical protein ACP5UQ_09505 [Anaerolineae bacterium]